MKKQWTLLFLVIILFSLSACSLEKKENTEDNKNIKSTEQENIIIKEDNIENLENTEEWILVPIQEETKIILSWDNWIYTNKNFWFYLKLPKKYWNDPRILILPKKENDSYYHLMILIPYYDKSYNNDIIPDTSSIPKRYVQGINYFILPSYEYQKQIKDKNNERSMFWMSGIDILKEMTVWYNNKYYFLAMSMRDILHEDWKKIIPALECKKNSDKIGLDCEIGLGNMFPNRIFNTFNI